MWPEPFSLSGNAVEVVPLSQDHESDLKEAAADGELHKLWYTMIPTPDAVAAEIDRRLDLQSGGSMLPFAIIDKAS
ncbi:MAG: N-acetyltransferase, partial [Pseudomonadota bacterium]